MDYFLISDVLLPLVRDVQVRDFNAGPRCAVQLTMASFAAIERVRAPRCPIPLPQQRPFGPDLPYEGWDDMAPLLAVEGSCGLRTLARGRGTLRATSSRASRVIGYRVQTRIYLSSSRRQSRRFLNTREPPTWPRRG